MYCATAGSLTEIDLLYEVRQVTVKLAEGTSTHRQHRRMHNIASLAEVVLQRLPGGVLRQVVDIDALADRDLPTVPAASLGWAAALGSCAAGSAPLRSL